MTGYQITYIWHAANEIDRGQLDMSQRSTGFERNHLAVLSKLFKSQRYRYTPERQE